MTTITIVGGGLAGAKAAEALRDNDFDGSIVLLTAEDHLPYERPPLSKEYLAGKKDLPDFTVDTAGWYREHLGMEYVGYAPTYAQVVFRGDPNNQAKREFTAFWLDGGNRVLAGMNVNIWEGLDEIKTVIRSKRSVYPDLLVNPDVPLADC